MLRVNLDRRKKYLYLGYPPEFNDKFRREIRQRDKLRCAICQKKKRLDVHHIDYKKQHTTRFNCISLCRDCHTMIHRSSWAYKQEWKYKLWRITAERERQNDRSTT